MRSKAPVILPLLMVVSALVFFVMDRTLPPQHLPWRPIDIDAPLGMATDIQLLRLSLSPSSTCLKMAENSQTLKSVAAQPHRPNPPCGWDIARKVSGSDVTAYVPGRIDMQCPLALGTHIWIREVDRLARRFFGHKLVKVHHSGSYSCRRQIGNGSGQWSEHAFANAWDITGFELGNGEIISVQRDWNGEDAGKRKFLRRARDKACGIFRVTLSPDYNAAHHDHFHVDMGPSHYCQ